MSQLTLTYPGIVDQFGKHLVAGRTESRAFLAWFLENYYRLDEIDAQDSVCDGPDDKGIDGIYVDENLERIDVFQAKLYQNRDKTIGDNALKTFAGALDQLTSAEAVERIIESTTNFELRGLLQSRHVAERIQQGYELRGVFISNAKQDQSATSYSGLRGDIVVHDGEHLLSNWIAPGASTPIATATTFQLDGLEAIRYRTPEAEVFVAPLLASELVKMSGLENQELFSWNVRQALGRTKVNRAIAESVRNTAEHKNFLLFHNGLTVLAESAILEDDRITISGYTVVNGCQSLSTLYENRALVSDELRLLTRVIKLSPQSDLAAKITRHSNNQNAITARDLQSNSTIQRRLQREFENAFDSAIGYEIKRGERPTASWIITNEEAGRMLLAFDLARPWSCHQSYKLFDELHGEIFGRPEVDAYRIAALAVMEESVRSALERLDDQLVAQYTLTRYFMMHLMRQALEVSEAGQEFCRSPKSLWEQLGPEGLLREFNEVVGDLVIDFAAEISERSDDGDPFDHKRELKSVTAVRQLCGQIMRSYEKLVRRGRASAFGERFSTLPTAIK